MKVTLLGTGTPEAHRRRASSGYLVEIGDDVILLDCGGGVFDRLLDAGRRPSDVTHIFFSHLHSDHMIDYARLIHAAWDEAAAAPVVRGPQPIRTIHQRLFGPEGALAFDLRARTEFPGSQEVWVDRGGTLPRPWPAPDLAEVAPGFEFQGDGWRLTSCEAPHAQPFLDCMALRIEAEAGGTLVYSGDAGLCPEIEALSADADLLLHWCYRLSGETKYEFVRRFSPPAGEIAAMAARAGVRRLALTHIRAHMDTEEAHETMLDEARAAFDGEVAVAEDLMVYSLP